MIINDKDVGRWIVDPSRSQLSFAVRHMWGMVTVRGNMAVEGETTVRPSGLSVLTVRLRADSIDTKNRKRDEHLRSPEFLDVARHEWVEFRAQDVPRPENGSLTAYGVLTVRGHEEPQAVSATVTRSPNDEVVVQASARLNRSHVGMTWNPVGMSSMLVRAQIRAVFVRAG